MGLAHEKKSYLQEKANLFEIGSGRIKYEIADKHADLRRSLFPFRV